MLIHGLREFSQLFLLPNLHQICVNTFECSSIFHHTAHQLRTDSLRLSRVQRFVGWNQFMHNTANFNLLADAYLIKCWNLNKQRHNWLSFPSISAFLICHPQLFAVWVTYLFVGYLMLCLFSLLSDFSVEGFSMASRLISEEIAKLFHFHLFHLLKCPARYYK